MVELRLHIPDETLEQLLVSLGPSTSVDDIPTEALTLLNWAVDERARGRQIFSVDPNGTALRRLVMPILDQAVRP